MTDAVDPWAGLVDPRATLAAIRRNVDALAGSSRSHRPGGKSASHLETTTYHDSSQSSHSSQGGSELSPASHNSQKGREKTFPSLETGTYEKDVSRRRPTLIEIVRADAGKLARAANRLECDLSRCNPAVKSLAGSGESFVVTNTVPGPDAHRAGPLPWREGVARLDRWTPPCDGFRSGEWGLLHRVIAHFMDHCADQAAARGWTAIDVFGVHGKAGAADVSSCGALMLPWQREVTSVSADAIAFGPLVYRRRPLPQAVLAWDFTAERT